MADQLIKSQERSIGYYTAYNALVLLTTPLWSGYLMQRYISGKARDGWTERWGSLGANFSRTLESRPRIWFHAVSAGEVVAAAPIVRCVRELRPDAEIIFSVITPAGKEMALQQVGQNVDGIFYFPFDLPWVSRRVVELLRPSVYVSLESELWPNVLHELKRHNIPTIMVNGRITERSFARARKSAGFFGWMLSHVDRLLVQSDADAVRIEALGGARLSGRIEVVGNSKFDQAIEAVTPEGVARLRETLRLPAEAPVLVAGSTRSTEEEQIVLDAYHRMRMEIPDLCLIVAPRQIDRAAELKAAIKQSGLDPICRTELAESAGEVRAVVLDTMGELVGIYAVASIAFVGNSFEPVVKGGGQNLLQPLAHGKPVLFGPRTATIRSEVSLVTEAGVGFRVTSAEEMAAVGLQLIQDGPRLAELRSRALALIASQRGASRRYAEAVVASLPPASGSGG